MAAAGRSSGATIEATSARSADTTPAAEQVQLDLLKRASVARRVALARSLSRSTLQLAWRAVAEANPGATDDEVAVRFVATCYGPSLAEQLRRHLATRRQIPSLRQP